MEVKCCQEPITRSIGKSGFRILQSNASEIRERISPPRNPSSGWIHIGISWISFLSFDGEIRKRICKTILVNSGLLFATYARARARPLFLRTVFQTLFRISQSNGKKKKKSEHIYLGLRSIRKSGFRF